MLPAQSFLQLALCLSTVGSVASALGWPRWLPELDALIVRADSADSSQSSATQDGASGSIKSDAPASATGEGTVKAGKTTGNLNTAKATSASKAGATGTGTKKGGPTRTQFPADAPAACISMLTPDPTVQPSGLFKISDYVTFAWNYNSLLEPPIAIGALVECPSGKSYPLTDGMPFQDSVTLTWDTKNEANNVENPLGNGQCQLVVKDSNASTTDPPRPGRLNACSGYTFGMYTGQPYTPYPDWSCPGSCSAASSVFDHQAVCFAVVTSVVTFLSFTC
ncbi:hypothetical protein ED733_006060 [Metarhizium rileyi]|uniref:DUF7137 domain-containing protein n=1 Tax=Metarhizium rileyi (strain RCEF 4871) TaxID=1649241 RepID=A0A5C6GD96_METRR|nr:hypothetical protein ED733_006060 [Metarhizium rileyi]